MKKKNRKKKSLEDEENIYVVYPKVDMDIFLWNKNKIQFNVFLSKNEKKK